MARFARCRTSRSLAVTLARAVAAERRAGHATPLAPLMAATADLMASGRQLLFSFPISMASPSRIIFTRASGRRSGWRGYWWNSKIADPGNERAGAGEAGEALLDALLQLDRASGKKKRPGLREDIGEQFMDNNPPLPGVLIVFAEHDSVEMPFDDESQNMLESVPEPNLIVPLNAFEPKTVRQAFDALAALCDTLAAATRFIDLVPGKRRKD